MMVPSGQEQRYMCHVQQGAGAAQAPYAEIGFLPCAVIRACSLAAVVTPVLLFGLTEFTLVLGCVSKQTDCEEALCGPDLLPTAQVNVQGLKHYILQHQWQSSSVLITAQTHKVRNQRVNQVCCEVTFCRARKAGWRKKGVGPSAVQPQILLGKERRRLTHLQVHKSAMKTDSPSLTPLHPRVILENS
ncbi:hypothetical protein HPG69_012685 [Diceros bicornis minor]|uniref:Uncharacterized protein n=1 Tax=Diceros bicornis minor TaxID=77932 RepID=A0A7J7EIR1_DICBM|nr:hypothetical protein HPG69_012685 [Diceros bicornis minor]